MKRDEEKREECKNRNISLIEIPFWWDGKPESLIATIHRIRPDVIPQPGLGTPISSEVPQKSNYLILLWLTSNL